MTSIWVSGHKAKALMTAMEAVDVYKNCLIHDWRYFSDYRFHTTLAEPRKSSIYSSES
jgi:hypothetical protein